MQFTDIIELLLQKKASLDEEMELEIEIAISEVKAKYAERSDKINGMLDLAGYVEPVQEPEVEAEELVGDEVGEETDGVIDEAVNETEAASGETFGTI